MTTNPQTDRRDRYAETMARTDGWEWAAANFSSLSTPTADRYRRAAEAVMAVADAEQAELRRERDLAIAHDRQPYPTAWAYEQACKTLRRKEAGIERVLEFAASLDDIGRQLAGPDAVHPVAAHIRHLLDTQPADGPSRMADEEQQPAESEDDEALRAKVDEATATLRRIRSTLRSLKDQGATGRTYYQAITDDLAGPRPDPAQPAAVEEQPDTNTPPVDPWSISYHQLGPAENNPAVCICGLGPEAVLHNEPPHRFNGRPKPGMPPVHGICTLCHHHETAACHTAAVAQPGKEA